LKNNDFIHFKEKNAQNVESYISISKKTADSFLTDLSLEKLEKIQNENKEYLKENPSLKNDTVNSMVKKPDPSTSSQRIVKDEEDSNIIQEGELQTKNLQTENKINLEYSKKYLSESLPQKQKISPEIRKEENSKKMKELEEKIQKLSTLKENIDNSLKDSSLTHTLPDGLLDYMKERLRDDYSTRLPNVVGVVGVVGDNFKAEEGENNLQKNQKMAEEALQKLFTEGKEIPDEKNLKSLIPIEVDSSGQPIVTQDKKSLQKKVNRAFSSKLERDIEILKWQAMDPYLTSTIKRDLIDLLKKRFPIIATTIEQDLKDLFSNNPSEGRISVIKNNLGLLFKNKLGQKNDMRKEILSISDQLLQEKIRELKSSPVLPNDYIKLEEPQKNLMTQSQEAFQENKTLDTPDVFNQNNKEENKLENRTQEIKIFQENEDKNAIHKENIPDVFNQNNKETQEIKIFQENEDKNAIHKENTSDLFNQNNKETQEIKDSSQSPQENKKIKKKSPKKKSPIPPTDPEELRIQTLLDKMHNIEEIEKWDFHSISELKNKINNDELEKNPTKHLEILKSIENIIKNPKDHPKKFPTLNKKTTKTRSPVQNIQEDIDNLLVKEEYLKKRLKEHIKNISISDEGSVLKNNKSVLKNNKYEELSLSSLKKIIDASNLINTIQQNLHMHEADIKTLKELQKLEDIKKDDTIDFLNKGKLESEIKRLTNLLHY
jgi:hypothetical protein